MQSSVFAAFDALLDICNGLDVLEPLQVEVFDSDVTGQAQPAAMIVVGGIDESGIDGTAIPSGAAAGNPPNDEEYVIPVAIVTFTGGKDQKTVRDELGQIEQSLHTALQANPTLSGTVLWSWIGSFKLTAAAEADEFQGRFAYLTLGINCRQRIYP
jgi:hypothetical protein